MINPTLIEYRFRIRTEDHSADAVVITSVRGDDAPYLASAPKGDGASFDPASGKSIVAAYTGTIADWPMGSMQRAITSQLEDANGQQQLGYRRTFLEFRYNGGLWPTDVGWDSTNGGTLVAGVLTLLRLTDAMTWEYTVNDFTRAQMGANAFAPATSMLITDFLAAWPHRGCLFGGPVTNPPFTLGFSDSGGWQMRVHSIGFEPNHRYWLEPVTIEGPPTWMVQPYGAPKPNLRTAFATLDALASTINQAAAGLLQFTQGHISGLTWSTIEDTLLNGFWAGLIYLINGVPFRPAGANLYDPTDTLNNPNAPNELISTVASRPGVFCVQDGQTALTDGAIVTVRCFTILPSDISPIYFDGHPLDLLTALWDAANIPYNAAAVAALQSDPDLATPTAGAFARIGIRATAPTDLSSLIANAIGLPYGIGIRANAAGELEPFRARVGSPILPTVTITSEDVVDGSTTLPFELDTGAGLNAITITQQTLASAPSAGSASMTLDGIVTGTSAPIPIVNGDASGLQFGTLTINVPGMMHTDGANDPAGEAAFIALAQEFFDRFGHGSLALETTLLRGGAGDALNLGDEALVALPQLPNHNYRLGDNGAIAPRAMQVIRLTEQPSGRAVRLLDSGPNVQPLATAPTLAIAASSDVPEAIANVTITNAAALNALGYAVRLQWAVNSGATPAAGDYVSVMYFAAGAIPTTAFALPAVVSGSLVWARARSELSTTARPSAYGTAVSVTLTAIDAPTSVTATPSTTDASLCSLAWAIGAHAAGDYVDVWLRLYGQSFSQAIRQATLSPGSVQFTLERLATNIGYVASVQHKNTASGDTSDPVDVTFTSGMTVRTLAAPTDPQGFAGTLVSGAPQQDGTYGLAVIAQEIPGYVEYWEGAETAPGSGAYGTAVAVGKLASLSGDYTTLQRIAPQDGLRRSLTARQVADGCTPSAFTAAVIVTPWAPLALPTYAQSGGQGTVAVAADGEWAASVEAAPNVQSFKYLSDTSAFPSAASVLSSGTLVTGDRTFAASGGPLTFGQTVYLTVIPFTGLSATGTPLPAIRLIGAYLTYTATKTVSYPATGYRELTNPAWGFVYDDITDANVVQHSMPVTTDQQVWGMNLLVPDGVTITEVAANINFPASIGAPVSMEIEMVRGSGIAGTGLGTANATSGGGWQLVPITLSESTTGNQYQLVAIVRGGAGGEFGGVVLTYTMPDPSKTF